MVDETVPLLTVSPVGRLKAALYLSSGAASSKRAQDDRQPARLVDERGVLDNVGALERDPEEEPQRGHGVIENRNLRVVLRRKQLKASDLFEASGIWRSAEECSKALDDADVALVGCGANLRIAMSSILRRRNGLLVSSVMRMLLS